MDKTFTIVRHIEGVEILSLSVFVLYGCTTDDHLTDTPSVSACLVYDCVLMILNKCFSSDQHWIVQLKNIIYIRSERLRIVIFPNKESSQVNSAIKYSEVLVKNNKA